MKDSKLSIYLDTNVFIAAYEGNGDPYHAAWLLLDYAEEKKISLITSELTVAETLVRPMIEKDDVLKFVYQTVLTSDDKFSVLPIERNILISAAHLRAKYRSLKLPDAIHLATANHADCAAIITDDRRLPYDHGISVVRLSQTILSDLTALTP